jgi:dTDP-4-amino-4,6-dideoxygalactose transaminase
VFADIDPATFNLDPAGVEKIVQDSQPPVRAMMPVHLYGQCADMDAFASIAKEHGVAIIEDAAQAFGASWRGRRAGTLGKAAAFSFYPTKNLSAYGDGGAVSTDDPEMASHVRRLRNHGSRQRYYHEEIGWNSRLDAIQAAILRVKLKHIDRWNQQRRTIRAKYDTLFRDAGLVKGNPATVDTQAPVALLETRPEAFHIHHQYVVRAYRRDELRAFLASSDALRLSAPARRPWPSGERPIQHRVAPSARPLLPESARDARLARSSCRSTRQSARRHSSCGW